MNPKIEDAEWQDFVISQFKEEELIDGNPKIGGLRRVVRKLLGPILYSGSKVIKPVEFNSLGLLTPITVEHRIDILWKLEDELKGKEVGFVAVADLHSENIDSSFLKYGTAVCATRAEAIALRKALSLQKVIAAEEIGSVLQSKAGSSGYIEDTQINFIKIIAGRNGIDVDKFINMGKNKYNDIKEIPFDTALIMLETLNTYQNDRTKIPKEIKKNG